MSRILANDSGRRSAPERAVAKFIQRGAPLGYHCPEPVPITLSEVVTLEKSPHRNASRLFVNWLMSDEAQKLFAKEGYGVPLTADEATLKAISDKVVAAAAKLGGVLRG